MRPHPNPCPHPFAQWPWRACEHIIGDTEGPGTSVVYLLDQLREIYERPVFVAKDFRIALGRLKIMYCDEWCVMCYPHNHDINKALDSICKACWPIHKDCNGDWQTDPEKADAETTRIFKNLVSFERECRGAEGFIETDPQVTREEIWNVPGRFEKLLQRLEETHADDSLA